MIEQKNDAKAFMQQVKLLDMHINSKIEELNMLKAMTTKITSTLKQDMVFGGGGNQDKLGDAVSKIIDLEKEINESVDRFVDAKRDVGSVIENVTNPDCVAVLYKRYFLYERWEQIACELHCTFRHATRIHGEALKAVSELLKKRCP